MITEGRADIVVWSLYSTFRALAGETLDKYSTLKLFSTPVGRDCTLIDTNMFRSNMLPIPQHFNVTHLRPAFGELNDDYDIANFKNNVAFQFMVADKVYFTGPLCMFQKVYLHKEAILEFLELVKVANDVGYPLTTNALDLRLPNSPIGVHILQGQQFSINLFINKDIKFRKDFDLCWFLDGVMSRSVQ